jgi:hypothetical protein
MLYRAKERAHKGEELHAGPAESGYKCQNAHGMFS